MSDTRGITNRYQNAWHASSMTYMPRLEVWTFSPKGTALRIIPRVQSVVRYLGRLVVGIPVRSAIRACLFAPPAMARNMELYEAGSKSSWRSSAKGSS